MKQALITLLDDNFMVGFVGFWKSFIYHNKWFIDSGIDLIVLNNGLSEENKKVIESYHSGVIFRNVKKNKYTKVNFSRTHERLQATYYKLDCFGIYEYERITFLDSDITVLGDIKEVFEFNNGFCACNSYNARLDRINENSINSGVFTINKKYINKHTYNDLVRLATKGFSMPDQKVINIYFANNMYFMPKGYNVEKRMWKTEKYKNIWEKKKILHWVANKPWDTEHDNEIEESFKEIYPVWEKYYSMDWKDILEG